MLNKQEHPTKQTVNNKSSASTPINKQIKRIIKQLGVVQKQSTTNASEKHELVATTIQR